MSRLCRKCCGISFKPLEELNVSLVFVEENQGLRQPLDDDTFYFHNSTLTELEELKADCHLCYLMVDALRPENAEVNMLDSDEGQVFLVLRKDRRSSVVREPISYDVHVWAGQSKGHLVCKMFSDSISSWDSFGYHRTYLPDLDGKDNDTGSPNSMRLARHWLSTCRNGHHCGKDHDMAPLLPTRTVEVNPEDGGPPRLHISAAGERACYVTLSYCWGDQNKIAFLKTKRNNLAQHVQALPGNMHKTLQDAIQATKDLGFRYLWIDALCIIQDDPLGTGKEIGKMGDIYRSTSLTLAAANGQDVTAGLFVPRSSLLHRPCFLTLDITGRRHRAFIYRFPFESIIALETRLWVLQEQILSPRTLVFRTDHMEWRCSDGSIHESIPSGHISKRPHTNIDELQSFVAQSRSGSQRMFPFNEWYRAVSALSTRRATYITDQLPALAGVASVLEDVCGLQDRKRYVAGLWVDDIYAGLVWVRKRISSISGNVARMDAASSFIAPTWSWAAKPVGLVTFFATSLDDTARKLRVFRRLATIERIHCEPEMPLVNPFGKVKPGAYLRVRGKLKTAVIGHPTLEYHFELDLRALYARGNEPIAGIFDVTADSMSPRIVGLVTFDCAEDRNTLTEVQVMPFLRFPDNDSSWESPCSMICLALVGSGNQYRRVGIIGVFREPRIISRDPEVDKPVAIVDNSPGNIYWDDNVWDGIGESVIQIY